MQVRISDRIDQAPIGPFQLRTVFLCVLVALLDGLDVQTMALVIPTLADHWGIQKASFGPVLSASFAGLMIGALAGGILGDRHGRRIILIVAFMVVGSASILTATAQSAQGLIGWRFLTGLGIGACMPNFTVLTAEYIPTHRQAFFITLLYSAIPVGGILGGFLAPAVIAHSGWQAVFILSGLIPLSIAIMLFVWLPESPRYLAGCEGGRDRLAAILERIDPSYRSADTHQFVVDARIEGSPVGALFRSGRTARTLILWLILFCNLGGLYLITSWLPTLLVRDGWSNSLAAQSISYFWIGGALGCIAVGWLIDRFGPYNVLSVVFIADAVFTALIGLTERSYGPMMSVLVLGGFIISAAQTGTMVLAARLYPTSIRSTGVGWGLGVGRIGAIISPLLGGAALAAQWSRQSLFLTAAVPAIVCAIAMLLLRRTMLGRGAVHA